MCNGGIGTHNWLLAHLLAAQGWYVHVLFCGAIKDRKLVEVVKGKLAGAGIGWSAIQEFDLPGPWCVPGLHETLCVQVSELVRHALAELHARHHFHLAEFGEWGALGFRAIQARRLGLDFPDLPMLVRLHSSSQWMREGNRQWLDHLGTLVVDYLERYCFDNADFQVSPSRYMLEYARRAGWAVRPDALVSPYTFKTEAPSPTTATKTCLPGPQSPPELVFFGRLETRKGLEIFIQAVRQLDPAIPVTFLGRVNTLSCEVPVTDYIREELRGRPYTLLTDCNREQALRTCRRDTAWPSCPRFPTTRRSP